MKLRDSNSGLILTLVIIGGLVVVSYITWNNFLASDQGQELQETTTNVLDTIENTADKATGEDGLIDRITQ